MILGSYQSQIKQLGNLPANRYENIFRMYTTPDNQYYYNILQSIYIDGNIDETKIFYINVKQSLPWSIISYNTYGTTDLWWLITLINKIENPVKAPVTGTVLKAIRSEYIPGVLAEIKQSLG